MLQLDGLPVDPDTRVWLVEEGSWPAFTAGRSALRSIARERWSSRVDDRGRASFRGLAPGRYRLHCGRPPVRFDPPELAVPADGPVEVRWEHAGE